MSAQQSENSLHRTLNETRQHDHLCLIYETEQEQFDATVEFIKIGLARNERCHFSNDEAATKLIYLALKNITKEWKMSAREWNAAMTQFAILLPERFVQL